LSNSAIILAGGISSRLGEDKGLLALGGKPMVKHVLAAVDKLVDQKIIVASSRTQAEKYAKALGQQVEILIDRNDMHGPLAGASTGLQATHGKYSLLLPCDTPFASKEILSLLFELCINRNAAIPRWPNCYIEPLQAAYSTEPALAAAETALCEGKMNLQAMVDRLRSVRYISTLVFQQLDPELRTFYNVNTPLDLRKAEAMLKKKKGPAN